MHCFRWGCVGRRKPRITAQPRKIDLSHAPASYLVMTLIAGPFEAKAGFDASNVFRNELAELAPVDTSAAFSGDGLYSITEFSRVADDDFLDGLGRGPETGVPSKQHLLSGSVASMLSRVAHGSSRPSQTRG